MSKQRRRVNVESPACQNHEKKIGKALRAHRACRTDDDCRLLVRKCSPYQTCGQPVNKGGLSDVKAVIGVFAKQCPSGEPICVDCPGRSVQCEEGLCRVYPPIVCTQDVRTCPDGSTVSRNADYDCQFDPCPEPAPAPREEET